MIIFGIACLKPDEKLIETLNSLSGCKLDWTAVVKIKNENPEYSDLLSDPRYDVIYGPDSGIYDAFNIIAKRAKEISGYLIYLGCGDVLLSDLAFIAGYIGNENMIFQCRAIIVNKKNGIQKLNFDGELCKDFYSGHPYTPCHQACITHTTVFDLIGDFSSDYRIAGDADHFIRAYLNKIEIVKRDDVIVEMGSHGVSSDPIYYQRQISDNIGMYKKYRSKFNWRYLFHLGYFVLKRYLNGNMQAVKNSLKGKN